AALDAALGIVRTTGARVCGSGGEDDCGQRSDDENRASQLHEWPPSGDPGTRTAETIHPRKRFQLLFVASEGRLATGTGRPQPFASQSVPSLSRVGARNRVCPRWTEGAHPERRSAYEKVRRSVRGWGWNGLTLQEPLQYRPQLHRHLVGHL